MAKARGRTTAGREQIETELKLAFPPEAAGRLADHPALKPPCASAPRSERLVSTYFDTPSRELARRGLSLRVRAAGPRRVQTLKASGPKSSLAGAAMSRGEWEWPLRDDKPDLALAAGNPIASRLPPNAGTIAADRCDGRCENHAHARLSRKHDRGCAGFRIDRGGRSQQAVHELELESRRGAPGALYGLALSLHAVTPLSIEVDSKAARGYRLRERSAPTANKPTSIELDSEVAAGDGLRLIVGEILTHLLANKSAALAGDAEGVHQLRIAIRRLRTALRLFAPRLEPHAAAAFLGKLQRTVERCIIQIAANKAGSEAEPAQRLDHKPGVVAAGPRFRPQGLSRPLSAFCLSRAVAEGVVERIQDLFQNIGRSPPIVGDETLGPRGNAES